MKKPTLYIVIPCYNEESVLPITGPLFSDKLSELEEAELIAEDSRILFVNDGSGDRTWELIRAMAAADPRLLPLLMTWGLDEFSVSASAVLSTRAAIRQWLGSEARKVTQEAMGLSTLAGVEGYLAGSTAQ